MHFDVLLAVMHYMTLYAYTYFIRRSGLMLVYVSSISDHLYVSLDMCWGCVWLVRVYTTIK